VTERARNNTIENFKLVFDRNFLKTVISRMDENDAQFKRILDDTEFQEAIKDYYGRKIYQQARGDSAEPNAEG
jgi:type I restriction enzyme R subunit